MFLRFGRDAFGRKQRGSARRVALTFRRFPGSIANDIKKGPDVAPGQATSREDDKGADLTWECQVEDEPAAIRLEQKIFTER